MTKKQRVGKNAQRTTIYLSPAATVALKHIEARRQYRGQAGDSPSEIVEEAIWKFLEEVEKIPREEVLRHYPALAEEPKKRNVTPIRKDGDKTDS